MMSESSDYQQSTDLIISWLISVSLLISLLISCCQEMSMISQSYCSNSYCQSYSCCLTYFSSSRWMTLGSSKSSLTRLDLLTGFGRGLDFLAVWLRTFCNSSMISLVNSGWGCFLTWLDRSSWISMTQGLGGGSYQSSYSCCCWSTHFQAILRLNCSYLARYCSSILSRATMQTPSPTFVLYLANTPLMVNQLMGHGRGVQIEGYCNSVTIFHFISIIQMQQNEDWLQWEKIEVQNDYYTARTGHATVHVNNKIYIFGGIDENDRQNDILEYNILSNEWNRLKVQGDIPSARSGSVGISYNNALYFFGGYTRKHGEYFNDLFKFNPINQIWIKLQLKNPPMPRIDHSFSKSSNLKLCILFGGSNGIKKLNDLYELHLDKLEWRKILFQDSLAQPTGRFGHTSVIDNDIMYLFGGWDGTNTLNDMWLYYIKQQKWILLESNSPPASRYRHSAIIHNKCMYVFGGVDSSQERFGDLHEYSIQLNVWRRILVNKEGPTSRSFHKCVQDDTYMYIIGGYDGQRKNDLYRINLQLVQIQSDEENIKKNQEKGQEYVLLSLVNQQQSVKEYQTLLKTLKQKGKRLIQTYQQFPKMRWFYLEQDANSLYTPRTGHASVCTENSIYIFGGIDIEGNRNNDLFCYDFNENTWRKLNPENQPPERRSGSKCLYFEPSFFQNEVQKQQKGEIVFFGGYINKDIQHCNDLTIYDIGNNSWNTIQINGEDAPAKRTDHSMVRFSKFIYIFGGRGENKKIFNDLRRFHYKKRIWKNIKGEGSQVVARFGHIGVTYEHSMYIFGGWDGTICLDDLYQYSYVTNIWYEIRRCVGEKPSPRYRHDVLVYRESMFIFGGVDQHQRRFNDLYQFKFGKREWSNILTSGCLPSPRTFHKIVNHENILFVMGGFDGERKNDLHMMVLEQEQREPQSNLSLSVISDDKTMTDSMNDSEMVIKMLNEQVKELSKKLQKEEDKNLCKICFAREIDTVIMECAHFILCFKCAANLKNCPICRSEISRVIQTHLY